MKRGWTGKLTQSPEETIMLGVDLAAIMETGDVITLNGELASGKTTFMKGVLRGLNFEKDVTSPTFTLINEYDSYPPVTHIDCYREHDLNRWQSLGIQEYFVGNGIVFIEWAEFIRELLPVKVISISFTHIDENSREISLSDS